MSEKINVEYKCMRCGKVFTELCHSEIHSKESLIGRLPKESMHLCDGEDGGWGIGKIIGLSLAQEAPTYGKDNILRIVR